MVTDESTKFLIIVNSIRPYLMELVVNVLASPINAKCRFRYNQKYCPELKGDPNSLIGLEGTIILRNRETAEFIPIRTCKCVEAKKIGDIIYIVVELLEITGMFETQDEVVKGKVTEFSKAVSGQISGYSNPPCDELYNLVLLENGEVFGKFRAQMATSESEAWGKCVKYLAENLDVKDVDFFRICEMKKSDGTIIGFNKKSDAKLAASYNVKFGERYELSVLQRTYTENKGDSSVSGKRYLVMETSDPSVEVRRGMSPIFGKYDIHNLHFRISTTAKKTEELIFVYSTTKDGDLSNRPILELPLTIRIATKLAVLRSVMTILFIISTITFVYPPLIPSLFGLQLLSESAISLLSKSSLIAMVLTGGVAGRSVFQLIGRGFL